MSISRLWLALVLALVCLPLFVAIGRPDLRGDEAAHSFAVDRILETGDWLIPKSSPSEDAAFLEKPPLKFWIVAAPIRLGLLPHNEFGLRFWDALLGGAAFLYVFAIGRRLAGPVCGVSAALILFVHRPLLFEHGLLGNNMEAALLLSYCGGVYHYCAWTSSASHGRRRLHAIAVGLYFALGFMTKFVAVFFLPVVLGLASLLVRDNRARLVRDRRMWLGSILIATALIAPWFIYAYVRFGAELWDTIFGAHVYSRFTASLDPTHLNPWNFYFVTLFGALRDSNTLWLVVAGAVLLAVQALRRPWTEGVVVLLWYAVPTMLISVGTSKLYHYAYPFLPPVALAGGYATSFVWETVRSRADRSLAALERAAMMGAPRLIAVMRGPVVRPLLLSVAIVALAVSVAMLLYGPIVVRVSGTTVFRNSSVFRPWLIGVVLAILGGWLTGATRLGIGALILVMLPVPAYRKALAATVKGEHRMRTTRDCILRVASQREQVAPGPRGLYVAGPDSGFGHEHIYYFRGIRPWERSLTPSAAALDAYLYDPSHQRPILIAESSYQEFMHSFRSRAAAFVPSPPLVSLGDAVMLLPGPFAVCSDEVTGRTGLP